MVYDQPKFIDDILEEMLHQIKQNYFGNKPIVCDLLQRLSTVCDALQMPEIKKIILKHYLVLTRYGSSSDLPVASTSDQVKALFSLLFEGYLSIKDKLDSFLDFYGIFNQSTILDNEETLDHKIDSTTIFSNVDLLKTMFNFGLDINSVDNEGTTLFTSLLQIENITAYRDIFELAIFHNPDLSSHKSAISYGLKADLRLYELTLPVKEFEVNHHPLYMLYKAYGGSVDNQIRNYGYVMDAKLHGSFGHDAENSCFNFFVPFLMECGFQVSTEDNAALDSLTDGSLHPDELEYIKHYLASPRSLKQECRTALRRHYTGSQIHQFVELVTMPQQIKDYILLRPTLKILSSNYIS